MLLSIVICNRNHSGFLDAAIRSALTQSYRYKEVIVVDDASSDGSRDVIARWSGQLRGILLDTRRGQVALYNQGFAVARGDVVIFLDAHDLLDLDVGERVVGCFRSDPGVVKVHYRMRLIDANGCAFGSTIPRRLATGDTSDLLARGLLYDSSPGSGNAYRCVALQRLMPLPESPNDYQGADFYALLGISLLGTIRSLGPQSYASYRVHPLQARGATFFGNVSTTADAPARWRARYNLFAGWIQTRLGQGQRLSLDPVDFSTEKQTFAGLVFGVSYRQGIARGGRYFASKLVRSIWLRPSSLLERVALCGWAVMVLVLPRVLGLPIARLVCNPASRR